MEEHVLVVLAEMRRHRVRDGDSKYLLTLRRQIIARALSEEKAAKWLDWLRGQPVHPWALSGHCPICDSRLTEEERSRYAGLGLPPEFDCCTSCEEEQRAEDEAEAEAREEAEEEERLWWHDRSYESSEGYSPPDDSDFDWYPPDDVTG